MAGIIRTIPQGDQSTNLSYLAFLDIGESVLTRIPFITGMAHDATGCFKQHRMTVELAQNETETKVILKVKVIIFFSVIKEKA